MATKYWDSIQSLTLRLTIHGEALDGKVWKEVLPVEAILDTKAQKTTFKRIDPCDHFDGHNLRTPWDEHHLVYFFGYAIWNYHCFPFCLVTPGIKVEEMEGFTCDDSEKWRRLRVEFPEDFVTHYKTQDFFFDEEFRLRRQDYEVDLMFKAPDIIPVRHYCYNHIKIGKLVLPTTRVATAFLRRWSHICPFQLQHMKAEVNHEDKGSPEVILSDVHMS
ncbi:hypothetical protein HDV63DRAFT_411525 [Trichoderma sp. SZMC 28014]